MTAVTTGVLASGVAYSTSFAALLAQGWQWLESAGAALAVAVVPGVVVGSVTHWIQQTGVTRNNIRVYAMDSGLRPALETMRGIRSRRTFDQFVAWGNSTSNFTAPLPEDAPWQTILILDDGVRRAAESYNAALDAFTAAEKRGMDAARSAAHEHVTAVVGGDPHKAMRQASTGNMAVLGWHHALYTAAGKVPVLPEANFRLTGDGLAEGGINSDVYLVGERRHVEAGVKAVEVSSQDSVVIEIASEMPQLFGRWRAAADALHHQLELVQALGHPRNNNWVRRRMLSSSLLART